MRRKAGFPPQQAPICAYLRLSRVNLRNYKNVGAEDCAKRGWPLKLTEFFVHGLHENFVNPIFYSPACFIPKILSSVSFSPTPRSISLLPRRASMEFMPIPPIISWIS